MPWAPRRCEQNLSPRRWDVQQMEESTAHHVGNSSTWKPNNMLTWISAKIHREDGRPGQSASHDAFLRKSFGSETLLPIRKYSCYVYLGRGPQREWSSTMPHGDTSWWERIRLQIPIRGRQGPRKDLSGKRRYCQGASREEAGKLLRSQMGLKNIRGIRRFKLLFCLPLTSQGDGSEKAYRQGVSSKDSFHRSNFGQWLCIAIRVWRDDSSVLIHLHLGRWALGSLNLVQPILSGTIWPLWKNLDIGSGWTESMSVYWSSFSRLVVVFFFFQFFLKSESTTILLRKKSG